MTHTNIIDGELHACLIPFSIFASVNTLCPWLISITFSVRQPMNDLFILKININGFWKSFVYLTCQKFLLNL